MTTFGIRFRNDQRAQACSAPGRSTDGNDVAQVDEKGQPLSKRALDGLTATLQNPLSTGLIYVVRLVRGVSYALN